MGSLQFGEGVRNYLCAYSRTTTIDCPLPELQLASWRPEMPTGNLRCCWPPGRISNWFTCENQTWTVEQGCSSSFMWYTAFFTDETSQQELKREPTVWVYAGPLRVQLQSCRLQPIITSCFSWEVSNLPLLNHIRRYKIYTGVLNVHCIIVYQLSFWFWTLGRNVSANVTLFLVWSSRIVCEVSIIFSTGQRIVDAFVHFVHWEVFST